MRLEDPANGIVIDDAFPCSSAGEIRRIGEDRYEVGYKPERIPDWFQELLDSLFAGAGVPKEYMAHVRVANEGRETRRATLRFLLSPKGRNYMFPPWWIHRGEEWAWIPPEDVEFQFEAGQAEITVTLQPGRSVRLASARRPSGW